MKTSTIIFIGLGVAAVAAGVYFFVIKPRNEEREQSVDPENNAVNSNPNGPIKRRPPGKVQTAPGVRTNLNA